MALWSNVNNTWVKLPLRQAYRDKTAVIVCNGPSLNDIDTTTLTGPGRVVIGVNNSYPKVRPDFWVGMDNPASYPLELFSESFHKVVRGNKDTAPCGSRILREVPGVLFADVNSAANMWEEEKYDAFQWHENTLSIAIQLAMYLGCKRIVFVGVDLDNSTNHYADGNYLPTALVRLNQELYTQQRHFISELKRDGKAKGLTFITTSKKSKLNGVIDYISWEDEKARIEAELEKGRELIHVREDEFLIDPQASHTEALLSTILSTEGNILLLGYCPYAYNLVSAVAKLQNREVIMVSSNQKIADIIEDPIQLSLINGWKYLSVNGVFGTIFLDTEQLTRERVHLIPRLLKHCKKLVIHDADVQEKNPQFQAYIKNVPAKWYREQEPNTVVLDGFTQIGPPMIAVCRGGGEYTPAHANWLSRQLRYPLTVLTDFTEGFDGDIKLIPLKNAFPGWWAKMEVLDHVTQPTLMLDLDTVVNHIDLNWYNSDVTLCPKPFLEEDRIQSGIMLLLPEDAKKLKAIWDRDPQKWIDTFRGDQDFFAAFLEKVSYINEIASYKFRPNPEAPIVCFHGQPRPWNVNEEWVPKF